MSQSILTDQSNIYQCFQALAQQGLTAIGLMSMNNALDPNNVSTPQLNFNEQFQQQSFNGKPGLVGTIGTTTKYGTLNFIKIGMNNHFDTNSRTPLAVTDTSAQYGNLNLNSNYNGQIGIYTQEPIAFTYDPSGNTNSSFSAPASIYCSLAIRVG
ncbi:hypothetical protein KVL94_05010 [Helicobacter pylori]|nr:hypothetical protein KVL94_05010 [Helicobacter pylori]